MMMRRELWREEGKLTQTEVNAKSEMEAAERLLMGMMNKVRIA